ncbi:MAG TPA: hypothetical protein VL948_20670 [Verrucomicrobiae bacterium]|jgi:hypothetical protein|nr:hypothetical protein [Verrucomicrobiae bacterium]
MKAFAITMLSVSLAGLVAAGPLAAQSNTNTGAPKCQPANAPAKVSGQVVQISSTGDRITVRDASGAQHEFQTNQETTRDLKVGDRIEASLRPLPKC